MARCRTPTSLRYFARRGDRRFRPLACHDRSSLLNLRPSVGGLWNALADLGFGRHRGAVAAWPAHAASQKPAPAASQKAAPNAKQREECADRANADAAIEACTRIIQTRDESPVNRARAYLYRGSALRAKGEQDRAIADYTEAIRLDPKLREAYNNRGLAWRSKGDTERAVADFTQAIRIDPKYAMAYSNRAETFRLAGDYDRALPDFNEAIRLNPKLATTHNNRGLVWAAKGEYDRAIADYDEAIKLNPHPVPYHNRGNAWRHKGDYDRAIADFNEAIRRNPSYAIAFNSRANAWRSKNDLTRAIADYTEAIRIDSYYVIAVNNRGNAWRAKGDYDRAIADYTEAIRLNPKFVAAYFNRGLAFRSKGEFDRAIADYDEAARLDPKHAGSYGGRGLVYLQLGRFDEAIAEYSEALKLEPKRASSLFGRGIAKLRKGDVAGGNADIAAAKAIKADIAEDFLRIGIVPEPDTAAVAQPAAPPAQTRVTPPSVTVVQPSAPSAKPAVPPQLPSAPVTALRRVALVIGNSTYKAVAKLANPARDAGAIAQALRNIGFAIVTVELDVSRDQFIKSLRAFEAEAEKSDWAVIYYAGHGMELSGVNYLIPVDASPKTVRDIQDEAVPLERVMAAVENAKRFRLVILDACRDNPLVAQLQPSARTRSLSRGLSRIEPERGVLVAYSARHGQLALDGDGENSPFATALAKRMTMPNLEIGKLFRLVRDDVLAATEMRQEPFTYGSLPGEDLFFVQQ